MSIHHRNSLFMLDDHRVWNWTVITAWVAVIIFSAAAWGLVIYGAICAVRWMR